MKKTKVKKSTTITSLARKTLPVSDFTTEKQKHEDAPSRQPSESLCVKAGQQVGCIKAASSISDNPLSETEYFATQRKADASNQQRPHLVERSDIEPLPMKLPCSSQLEFPEAKASQETTTTQHKRRRPLSDENVIMCKKVAHGRGRKIPRDVEIIQKNSEGPTQNLDPQLFRPNSIQSASLEKVSRSDSEINMEQAKCNTPISRSGESSVVHSPFDLKIACSPSEIRLPEINKKIPNPTRKLKLQRTKK